jgi:hypothetical protein
MLQRGKNKLGQMSAQPFNVGLCSGNQPGASLKHPALDDREAVSYRHR